MELDPLALPPSEMLRIYPGEMQDLGSGVDLPYSELPPSEMQRRKELCMQSAQRAVKYEEWQGSGRPTNRMEKDRKGKFCNYEILMPKVRTVF